MTTKEQQIKHGFIYLLPVIVGGVFPFITLPIFTRILTKEDYGVLALAQVYAIFVNGLANFGMTAAYDRNYFQYRKNWEETAQLLFSTLLFVLFNFVILGGLTYTFKAPLSKLIIGTGEHSEILFLALCAQFFNGINYYYLAFLKNSEKASSYVGCTISSTLMNFTISLLLVAYLRIGVVGLVYAQFISGLIIFAILSYKFTTRFPLSISKPIFLESLKISYPLTPRIFFGIIGTQFDKYMIGLIASVGGVGLYSIGQKVSMLIFTFMTAIQNVFSPQVYKRMFDMKDNGEQSIGVYLTPFAYICIAIALMIALFSEEIFSVLTPPSYHGAVDIVIVLSMYYGFLFFGKLSGIQLIFMKKTHITSVLTMVSIALNVALNIPFIIKWGAIGAAWATLLAGLISGTISLIVAQRYYEIKWEYKKVGAIFLIFFASSILMLFLRTGSVRYEIRFIVKCISIACYLYLGVKLTVLSKENFLLLKRMIPYWKFA